MATQRCTSLTASIRTGILRTSSFFFSPPALPPLPSIPPRQQLPTERLTCDRTKCRDSGLVQHPDSGWRACCAPPQIYEVPLCAGEFVPLRTGAECNGYEGAEFTCCLPTPVAMECDDTRCASEGHDCCAPESLAEAALCNGPGWDAIRTTDGCRSDFNEGSYHCCRSQGPQPSPPPPAPPMSAAGKVVLVIVSGLFREFREGARSLHAHLFEPNSDVTFYVVVVVSFDQFASGKDHANGRDRCIEHPDDVAAVSREVYGAHRFLRALDSVGGRVEGSLLRMREHWDVLMQIAAEKGATHFYMTRPDAALSGPLPLRDVCLAYPDLNVLIGSFRIRYCFSEYDFDYGFLACDLDSLKLFAGMDEYAPPWPAAKYEGGRCCDNAPPQPQEFHGLWGSCQDASCQGLFEGRSTLLCREDLCRRVERFITAGKRLGRLDNHRLHLLRC